MCQRIFHIISRKPAPLIKLELKFLHSFFHFIDNRSLFLGIFSLERNGKPVAVLIAAEDYDSVRVELEDLRAAQRAAAAYDAWKGHPEDGRTWEAVRADLVAEGKLDE